MIHESRPLFAQPHQIGLHPNDPDAHDGTYYNEEVARIEAILLDTSTKEGKELLHANASTVLEEFTFYVPDSEFKDYLFQAMLDRWARICHDEAIRRVNEGDWL